MYTFKRALIGCFLLFITNYASAQRGKEGTVVAPIGSSIVNTYTYLTANASAGTNTLTVNNNAMTGGAFGGSALAPGDLIMVIQLQGATMDIDVTPTTVWLGNYTVPADYFLPVFPAFFGVDPHKWGQVTNYNQSGYHERIEVLSVSGSNTIRTNCNLVNTYTSTGHVQIIRIPRYTNLTVNAGSTITTPLWNGNTGGVVALEVDGTFTLNGVVSANATGFRGGELDPTSNSATGDPTEVRHLGSNLLNEGSRKGEGVGGYETEYAAVFSEYGIGAPANGGGGGGYQNTGGGGGSNVMVGGSYNGKGNPQGFVAIWNLETAGFGGSTSKGGGRGGYAYSNIDANETAIGPRNNAWGGDGRKTNGGFGGHPLPFVADRIWFGGGGGSGDQDSNEGGAGGAGGGIVFMNLYGPVAGTGTISANGEDGDNSNPSGASPTGGNPVRGEDGAGGGGAGGTIHIVNVLALPATFLLDARGGDGGDQVLSYLFGAPHQEAGGPGGSGSGGYVRITSGAPTRVLTAGANGTTNSTHMVNFPPNGATRGSDGFTALPANPAFNLTLNDITICSGATASLTATQFGAAAGTVTWYDAMVGGSVVTTGLSYATPPLVSTTTYWVGVCPGSFREPVTVTVIICLPTELTDFWHVCDPYPVLHWETASEHDNDYFTVERTCDLIEYEELATLNGQATSLSLVEYIYHDDDRDDCTDENVYYRLSQTDFNGAHTILGTISTDCEREIQEPAIATTKNSIIVTYGQEFQVNLYSTDGKLIYQAKSINGNAVLPKNEIPTGIYIVQVLADRQFSSRVLISD
jgi:hypothetical protein